METARYIKENSRTPTRNFVKKSRNTLLDAVNFQVHPILFEVALQDEAAAPPVQTEDQVHCKKELAIFPSPAGMSLTKLSLGGKKTKLFPPRKSLISDIPAGDGKTANSFLQCRV
jgi:hypothetical protein